MYTIATLEDLRRQLHLSAGDSGSDDDLLRALQEASHFIEMSTRRRYCPRVETLALAAGKANRSALVLPDDLLELHAVSDEGGAINLAQIALVPGHKDEPASILQLKQGAECRPASALRVSGVWGWHDRWPAAWRDSGDRASASGISAQATLIGVSDSDGVDKDGLQPRFQVGHLLRIDGEYLRVTAINHGTNRLTVLRGVGGTRATAHLRGAKIETYAPAPAIRDLTLRYAELMTKSVGPLELASTPLLERMRRLSA